MIYFDNGATTFPKPDSVINKMVEFMKTQAANPGRSGHKMALDAGRTIFEARHEITQLMNIDNPMNIVFTKCYRINKHRHQRLCKKVCT